MKSCIKKGKMRLQRLLYFVRGNEDENVPSLPLGRHSVADSSERQKHMCALEICNALAHLTWNEGLANFAENVAMRVCSRGILFMDAVAVF